MLILNLDRSSKIPLHKQVFNGVMEMIENNTLEPGTRLPATRVFAEAHSISRSVALKAYEELWSHGYLESRPGSYSVVRRKTPYVKLHQRSKQNLFDWGECITPASKEVFQEMTHYFKHHYRNEPDIIDMSSLSLDARIFPIPAFKKCLDKVMTHDPQIFNYQPNLGYIPLRHFIASRMQTHGICVNTDEILITSGSQSSIDLILKLLVSPGLKIATEIPTYLLALPLLKFYHVPIVTVAIEACGLNLHDFEEKLKTERPAFFYTIPNFHNPTGTTMSPVVREQVLAISEKYRVPIVEDSFEEEMKYFGKVPFSIKSMDKNQIVIYLSSFSKVLFPGIRIGWIAAEKSLIQRIAALKIVTDISSDSVIQTALYEFCQRGFYDIHVRRMHRIYKKRMQTTLCALGQHLTFKHVSWHDPLGGYLIWMKLGGLTISEDELHNIFIKHKVRVSPGSSYFIEKPEDHFIRLSISKLNEEEILEGIKRLKSALEEAYLKYEIKL